MIRGPVHIAGAIALALLLPARALAREPGVFRIPAEPTRVLELEQDLTDFLIDDLDGDGALDLLVATASPRATARRLQSTGSGTILRLYPFREGRLAEPTWSTQTGGQNIRLTLADLDGDGDDDLLVVSRNGHEAYGHIRRGRRGLGDEAIWIVQGLYTSGYPVVADFDGNGRSDLFLAGGARDHFYFDGSEHGPDETPTWTARLPGWATRAVVADVDGDGFPDVVQTHWDGKAYGVVRGTAGGLERRYAFRSDVSGGFTSLAVGDVDGDGLPEIAVGAGTSRGGDGRIRLYGNRGGAPTARAIWMSDDVDASPVELLLEDLDGDADLDLFVIGGDRSAIYENRDGELGLTPAWRASLDAAVARVADLDGDGLPDLVLGGGRRIAFHMGSKDLAPPPARPFPPPPDLPRLTAADLRPPGNDPASTELQRLLDAPTRAEREEALAAVAGRSASVMIALKRIGLIRAISDPRLLDPDRPVRPRVEDEIAAWIESLRAPTLEERRRAREALIECGPLAVELLEAAADGIDPNRSATCREILVQIRTRGWRTGSSVPDVIDVMRMGLARVTPELKKRYGLTVDEGALVISVPRNVSAWAEIGNLREGDVIVGVGSSGEQGRKVTPVTDPQEFVRLFVFFGGTRSDSARNASKAASLQWICGPNHPSEVGAIRIETWGPLRDEYWGTLQRARVDPIPWNPARR